MVPSSADNDRYSKTPNQPIKTNAITIRNVVNNIRSGMRWLAVIKVSHRQYFSIIVRLPIHLDISQRMNHVVRSDAT